MDSEYIALLPEISAIGTVIIDDFHRLEDSTKSSIADLLKITADREDPLRKLVIGGINEAGRSLIESAPDLANRIEIIRFEVEPAGKIAELVTSGENAFNVDIEARQHIIDSARGDPISHSSCAGTLASRPGHRTAGRTNDSRDIVRRSPTPGRLASEGEVR